MSLERKTNELLKLLKTDDPIGEVLGTEEKVEDTQPDMPVPKLFDRKKLWSYKYGKGGQVAFWEVTDDNGTWWRIAKSEPDGTLASRDFSSSQLHHIATAMSKLVKEE